MLFRSTPHYLVKEGMWVLNPTSDIHYGYIDKRLPNWSCGEMGHQMVRLLKPNDVPSKCALTDSVLREANLYVRPITAAERYHITQFLEKGFVEFEYKDKEWGYAALSGCLDAYWKKQREEMWGQSGKK